MKSELSVTYKVYAIHQPPRSEVREYLGKRRSIYLHARLNAYNVYWNIIIRSDVTALSYMNTDYSTIVGFRDL